jgi:UDP-glucose 4-epimerase
MDVAAAFVAAAFTDIDVRGEVFNVGSGRATSIIDLTSLLGGSPVIHLPKRPGEPDCTQADIMKISGVLGWAPLLSLPEGLAEVKKNIEAWRDAPVWTRESIEVATRTWFDCLGKLG